MGEKIDKFFKVAKCLDKLFDNLHEEKLLPDHENVHLFKQTKDAIKTSVKKAMTPDSEVEQTPGKV